MKFSYYFLNQEFTLCTDHSSLRWLDSFHDKATDVYYLEPFCLYMIILYRPGKLTQYLALVRIVLTMAISLRRYQCLLRRNLGYCTQSKLGQDSDRDLDTDLVPSLSNEEIKVSQKLDPELCRFMELLHKQAMKPNSKSLREEPPDVKILCSLWYEFRV